ncbi:MAG TPA: signal peptidase I [Nocardioides sp.]|nr:signal peptidase I [Nocardioides sp.]
MTQQTPASRCGFRIAARGLNDVATLAAIVVVLAGTAWILPSALGYERYVITGGSMSGTFEKGSVVFTQPVAEEDLEVGDVVTYVPPASSGVTTLVTHRIHDIRTRNGVLSFRTKGDANPDPDPWRFSLDADTQPVVAFDVPLVGHALIALADRDTRVLIIGLPAGAVALLALAELVKALRGGSTRPADSAVPVRTVATGV